jgi:hypothetical protein
MAEIEQAGGAGVSPNVDPSSFPSVFEFRPLKWIDI